MTLDQRWRGLPNPRVQRTRPPVRQREKGIVAAVALVIGVLIAAEGAVGLVVPGAFVGIVRFFQAPPVLYVASLIRIMIGIVLVLAAPGSRTPGVLRVLGVIVAIGGVLSPFIGARLADVFLGWSTGGTGVVRVWAALALVVGVVILYAVAPTRRAA